jgi:hypothetical protein
MPNLMLRSDFNCLEHWSIEKPKSCNGSAKRKTTSYSWVHCILRNSDLKFMPIMLLFSHKSLKITQKNTLPDIFLCLWCFCQPLPLCPGNVMSTLTVGQCVSVVFTLTTGNGYWVMKVGLHLYFLTVLSFKFYYFKFYYHLNSFSSWTFGFKVACRFHRTVHKTLVVKIKTEIDVCKFSNLRPAILILSYPIPSHSL